MPYPSPHEQREAAQWRVILALAGIFGLFELAIVAGLLAL